MMKETILEGEVTIGDKVFCVIRDTVPEDYQRYSIQETKVSDVSSYHGFVLDVDYSMWHDESEIGKRIFLTMDEAVNAIKDRDDFKGFVFKDKDGIDWMFKKKPKKIA